MVKSVPAGLMRDTYVPPWDRWPLPVPAPLPMGV